jgi:hypothetical protein
MICKKKLTKEIEKERSSIKVRAQEDKQAAERDSGEDKQARDLGT